MDNRERQNNVRYNIRVIGEIVENLKKKSTFKILSENIRERFMEKGEFEKSKTKKLCEETGIEEACFTGEKRFLIPCFEEAIAKNPDALGDIDANIKGFMEHITALVESFKRGELTEDENLERMMHYIHKDQSMSGYTREKIPLKKLCIMMEYMNNRELLGSDADTIKKFIKLAEEKIIISKAGLILNKNNGNDKS